MSIPEKEDFENNENEGIINNNGTVFVEGGRYRNIGNINATEYKDEPLELLRRYEQKIVKKSKENALVIAKNGDIYILKGDENSIPSHKMTKINFEDAFTLKTAVMNGDSVMMILVHLLI